MKKRYALFLLLFSTPLGAQVNDYFVNNPTWVCYHDAYPWPCFMVDSLNYYINGDSVINTMTYKKLYKRGRFMQTQPSPCIYQNYTYQDTVPTGFLRSQNLQMYFIPDEDSAEYLLYDFNLNVGSHLPLTYVNSDTTYTVTAIDSIYTSTGYRKRFFLNGNTSEFLIEGVGSSAGLLFPLGLLFEQNAALICYSQNDTAYWPAIGPSCSLITPVTTSDEHTRIEIYPNPSAGKFTCFTGAANSTVEIRNATGELVYTGSFNLQTEIDLSRFAEGMYVCIVRSNERTAAETLILK